MLCRVPGKFRLDLSLLLPEADTFLLQRRDQVLEGKGLIWSRPEIVLRRDGCLNVYKSIYSFGSDVRFTTLDRSLEDELDGVKPSLRGFGATA